MVDDLANPLSIPWDPSEMVIVAFVPPNITVSETDISFHMEKVSTWESNSMKITTITNKNIVSFNPLNYSYAPEPWMNVIFTFL
jgi:hypothetical protein